jgi:hypothetical protein
MNLNEHSRNSMSFPAGFATRKIETNSVTIHARVGGHPMVIPGPKWIAPPTTNPGRGGAKTMTGS